MADDILRTVTVTDEHGAALQAAVAAGEYSTVEAALADALDVWSHREEERADDLAWAKTRISASLAAPDPDLSDDEVEERLRVMFDHGRRRTDAAA